MKLKTLDQNNKYSEKEFKSEILEISANEKVLSKYIRVYLFNQREGNAKAKGRGEVSGGGRKPWKQKGTGRARHGSTRSPIWKGGGVTFGPTGEANYKRKLNKRESVIAFATALQMKKDKEQLIIADLPKMESAKDGVKFIAGAKLGDGKITIITSNKDLYIRLKNIKNLTIKSTADFSTYDVVKAKYVVFADSDFANILAQKEQVYLKK
jgi:large subunit ribosomal protein L4